MCKIRRKQSNLCNGLAIGRDTLNVSKIQNADGSPIAPVVIDGYAKQNNVLLDSNVVTSIHGRSNAIVKLLADALNNYANGQNTLFYWNKKQAIALLQKARVIMPKDSAQIHDGYITSIRDAGSPVKPKLKNVTESVQFKRWFGNWMENPQKASKIVNADGSPEILKLYVEEMYNPNESKTSKRAYKLNYIEQQQPSVGGSSNNVTLASSQATAANVHTVSDLFALVKRCDKKFSPKAASQIVNEDGSPKIMYHQSKADALTNTLNKSDSFLNQTCFFNLRYTVRYMVEKLATPPSRLEIGSARKTPLTPSPAKCGRRSVSGMTTMPFRKMEKKMA